MLDHRVAISNGPIVAEEAVMQSSCYCVLQKLPDGHYVCIEEIKSLEEAEIRSLLLNADSPGEYVVCNSASGKIVCGEVWGTRVC